MAEEFTTYFSYAYSLGFGDRPGYALLRGPFRRAFIALGFKHNNVFDWTEKRFKELYNEAKIAIALAISLLKLIAFTSRIGVHCLSQCMLRRYTQPAQASSYSAMSFSAQVIPVR